MLQVKWPDNLYLGLVWQLISIIQTLSRCQHVNCRKSAKDLHTFAAEFLFDLTQILVYSAAYI
jgi:hypothetical protein